jgi:DHA1 family tetracycline resistance protein-like MFS transporter
VPRPPRAERRPLPAGFWTIWTTVALDLVGFGIVAPVLGIYAERFGASATTVGLLFASFSAAQLVCAPLLGRLSDRVGRKPVILVSLAGTAIGSFLTGAAGSLVLVFLGRVIDGASGASVAVAQGAVTDLADPQDRPRLLGLLGAAFGVGFVVGPAIGSLAALGGPHVPFYVAGAVATVNLVAAWIRLPETRRPAASVVPATDAGASGAGSAPVAGRLGRLAMVAFLAVASFSAFEATFALFGNDRFGLTEGSVAAVFVGVGLFLVVVQGGVVHPVSRRWGPSRTVAGGLVIVSSGLAVLAAATVWPMLVLALGLLALGQGLVAPNLTAMVADRARADRRGGALGVQQSAGAAARIVGPALAGVLYHHLGAPAPYLVGAAVCALAVALAVSPA